METKENEMNEGLLIDYLNGLLSAEDQLTVEVWYRKSKKNQKVLEQLYFTHFVSERLGVMESVDVEKALEEFHRRIRAKEELADEQPTSRRFMTYIKYTAVAAAIVGLVFFGGQTAQVLIQRISAPYTIVTGVGERAQVILPDGTKVWINANSKVEYSTSLFSKERNVTMRGEAYFEVKKDPSAPFIVNSNSMFTKVLGTRFNIRANTDEHFITETLFEGSTLITAGLLPEGGVKMKPNQQFYLDTETGKSQLINCNDANDYIGWIDGHLHFEQASLQEITSTLERYYNIKISFSNQKLKEERFTCDFETTENIYQILSILRLTHKFDYTINKREVIIYPK